MTVTNNHPSRPEPRKGETEREAARRRTLARIRSLHDQANRLQAILDGRAS